MSDTSKWPENANSVVVCTNPWWRNVPLTVWMRLNGGQDLELLAQVDKTNLQQLAAPSGCPAGFEKVGEYARSIVEGRPVDDRQACELIQDVQSLTHQIKESELARAALNPHGLVILGARALVSGMLGTSVLSGREKIEIWKVLMSKALADAKSIDRAEVSEKLDRTSRSLKDTTEAELSKMSESEMRDLIQRAKDEQNDPRQTPPTP